MIARPAHVARATPPNASVGTPARPIRRSLFDGFKTGQITRYKNRTADQAKYAANSAVAPPAKGAYSTQPVMPVEQISTETGTSPAAMRKLVSFLAKNPIRPSRDGLLRTNCSGGLTPRTSRS
jgi:hypothetical protein